MALARYRVALTGFQGAVGINTWHWTVPPLFDGAGAESLGAELRTFYIAAAAYCRDEMTFNFPPFFDLLDEASGQLTGVVNMDNAPAAVNGNGTGGQLGRSSMYKLQLRTNTVANGRFVQGGIYLGPVAENAVGSDGSPNATSRAAVITALEALVPGTVGGTDLVVYKRPVQGQGGSAAPVASVSVSSTLAVLRSRRD